MGELNIMGSWWLQLGSQRKGKSLVCIWEIFGNLYWDPERAYGIQKGHMGSRKGIIFTKKSRLCREGHQQRLVEMHPMAEAAGTKDPVFGCKKRSLCWDPKGSKKKNTLGETNIDMYIYIYIYYTWIFKICKSSAFWLLVVFLFGEKAHFLQTWRIQVYIHIGILGGLWILFGKLVLLGFILERFVVMDCLLAEW